MKSNPWEEYPEIWKTQSAFMSFIRGGIRRGLWEKHPVKLEFIKENRFKAPLGKKTTRNPDGMVWACKCSLTGEVHRQTDCQVDHIQGNHSLKSEDDLKEFIMSMVYVTKQDLQMVSKEAHKIKSYSEKQGITFEEARAEKKSIQIIKDKQDKVFLEGKGIKPASNQAGRRQQIVDYLMRSDG